VALFVKLPSPFLSESDFVLLIADLQ